MDEFCQPIRVYVEDTDAGGIVYYVNYLKFMERARTEYLRTLGYDKPAVFKHNLMFVVKSVDVSYNMPAVLDDQLLVSASFMKVGRASFLMEQNVYRQNAQGDKNLLCRGQVKIACITQDSKTPAAIPEDMFNHLRSQLSA